MENRKGADGLRYEPNLGAVSIRAYGDILKHSNLLPGRRLLLDQLEAHITRLEQAGIGSLQALSDALFTPKRLRALSERSGVPIESLTVLRREIGALIPKPLPLSAFPGIPSEPVEALASRGIRTTKDYFEQVSGAQDFGSWGIGGEAAAGLDALCDLARINGVGAATATALFAAGFRCSRSVADADAGALLQRVTAANEAYGWYQARLGLKDMRFVIDAARRLTGLEGSE